MSAAEASDLETLRALNARFIHNFVTNDVESHDEILHPEFVCITAGGERVERDAYLVGWGTGFDPDVIVYWDYRDEAITVVDDVALVRSTNKHVVAVGSAETAGMTTYTDIYVLDAGRWLCLQAQLTTVDGEHFASDDTIVRRYVGGELQS